LSIETNEFLIIIKNNPETEIIIRTETWMATGTFPKCREPFQKTNYLDIAKIFSLPNPLYS
jgi:hypothetical protein